MEVIQTLHSKISQLEKEIQVASGRKIDLDKKVRKLK